MPPIRSFLDALRHRLFRPAVPELEPAEAYRRWADHYGEEPNELQLLEEEARLALLPDLAGRRVLDAGCGRGRATRLARERGAPSCVGVDLVPAMLAGDGGPGPQLAARVEALPFRARSFDVVISALVLGHVAGLDRAIAEMARVLTPGGHLAITAFHPAAARRGWRRTFRDPAEDRTFSVRHHPHRRADYLEALKAAGLEVEEMEEPQWQGQPVILALRARKTEIP